MIEAGKFTYVIYALGMCNLGILWIFNVYEFLLYFFHQFFGWHQYCKSYPKNHPPNPLKKASPRRHCDARDFCSGEDNFCVCCGRARRWVEICDTGVSLCYTGAWMCVTRVCHGPRNSGRESHAPYFPLRSSIVNLTWSLVIRRIQHRIAID